MKRATWIKNPILARFGVAIRKKKKKKKRALHHYTHLPQHWFHRIFLVVFPFDLQQLSYSYSVTYSI